MRIAALYDIHGNLPALEAVLRDVHPENVERVIVGGDIVPGPMPRECLDLLRQSEIPVQFISGNGEVAVLAETRDVDSGVPAQAREAVRWTAQQLRPADIELLATWPKTLRIKVNGLGEVLFCHATPRDENAIFTRQTAEERLVRIFAGVEAMLVVCGHTHMQFDRTIGTLRLINAGSVGMPFGSRGADWLLLGPELQLQRTTYDVSEAARQISRTSYPGAVEFAERYILHSPSEAEMLEMFSKAELR